MRAGLTVSIVAHAALLGFGLVAFPDLQPLEAEKIEAFPVDLVSVGDVTDLLEGDKRSEILPEETPQPKPEVEAEVPIPEPVEEEPVEKPVEAVRAPTPPPPPPPEPEPELEPEPEPEIAALPEPEPEPEPLPEAALEPAPNVPVEPNVPRARPIPPKPVAEPEVEPEKPAEAPERDIADLIPQEQPPEPEPEFNPDDIAALLNKEEPTGGGDPEPSPEPQTLGSIDGQPGAAMTQSEIAALQARLYRCWNPPIAVREAGALVVEVRIVLLPDGSLASPPTIVGVAQASDPLAQVAAESAIRAVVQCAPFGDILRPETYAEWGQIDFIFDPRQMLGG